MKQIRFSLLSILVLLGFACATKNTAEETSRLSGQLTDDIFSLTGDFHWNFSLMGTDQHSIHTFYADSITYKMSGSVYATDYTMKKLSFEKDKNKWIGQDENGIVYVLFFKDISPQSISLYKHKCKNNGLEEALAFAVPSADTTKDHGWNIYTKSSKDQRDILAIVGKYSDTTNEISITDETVMYNEKQFDKLSYHAGERRWVGQADDIYLQLFFENDSNAEALSISAMEFENLEKAYKTKYDNVQFTNYERQ